MPMSEKNRRYYAAKSQWQREDRYFRVLEKEREERRANRTPRNWKFWQTKKGVAP